jgi:hypothetical protein
MQTHPLVFAFLMVAAVTAQDERLPAQVVEPPKAMVLEGQDRVISKSGQFRITGGELADRSQVANLAEEAKNELLRLTDETGQWAWKIPVNIGLYGKYGDPLPARTVAKQLLFNETGYLLRMDLHLSRGIDPNRLKHAVTAAIIYDRALRTLPARESDTPFFVPPWLVEGLREATEWRLNQSDRKLYAALFRTGGLFKLDDLFSLGDRQYEEMDAAMKAAFRVSSGGLVMALLQQPQGKEGFRAFLDEVAAFDGEMPALLSRHFPELNLSENSLDKWWALQLANIGGQKLLTEILSVTETEKALTGILRLAVRTPEGIFEQKEFSAWPELAALKEPERFEVVRPAQEALVRLSYRCFPSYRAILAEYQIVLADLAKNQTKDVPKRLADLDERRATMNAKAVQARDYLDWFEITRARETSGAFDDYLRLKERLKANPHRRTDRLSQYLDRMDALFYRGGDPSPSGMVTMPDLDLDLPE